MLLLGFRAQADLASSDSADLPFQDIPVYTLRSADQRDQIDSPSRF